MSDPDIFGLRICIGIERHKNKTHLVYGNKGQEQANWLYEIRKRLSAFYAPEDIEIWLTTSFTLLNNKSAIWHVENLKIGLVRQVLARLEDSVYL